MSLKKTLAVSKSSSLHSRKAFRIDARLKRTIGRTFIQHYADKGRRFPWRRESDPYKWIVTEILLQMTVAIKVSRIYRTFFAKYPDVGSLARADPGELKRVIFDLGLYEQKSKGLIALANQLLKKHDGKVPDDFEQIMELPRVGRYIADATLCFAFGHPRALVDRNFIRVYSRIFNGEALHQRMIDEIASQLLPKNNYIDFNLGFLDFAAEVCKAVAPKCGECSLKDYCAYYKRNKRVRATIF